MRSVIAGSTRAARLAGIQLDSSAAGIRTITAPASVRASTGCTPYCCARSTRAPETRPVGKGRSLTHQVSSPAHDHAEHIALPRAKRHPNADFACAFLDSERPRRASHEER